MNNYFLQNNLIKIGILIIVLFWSMWFWHTYPREIFSTDVCWTDSNPRELRTDIPYCKGYNDGYEWQRTQSALDCHINNKLK
jgi:hypothetical protein